MVVEDNELVRETLVALLETAADITVVAECGDGADCLEMARVTQPDVVLMDVVMPRVGGIEATRILLAAAPDTRVVLLTGQLSTALVRAAHALGAVGYLLKGDDPADLITAIRAVAEGGTAWSPPAAAAIASG